MHADIQNIDTLIKNAKVFNNGEAAVIEDVAVSDGRISARGKDLNEAVSYTHHTLPTNHYVYTSVFAVY